MIYAHNLLNRLATTFCNSSLASAPSMLPPSGNMLRGGNTSLASRNIIRQCVRMILPPLKIILPTAPIFFAPLNGLCAPATNLLRDAANSLAPARYLGVITTPLLPPAHYLPTGGGYSWAPACYLLAGANDLLRDAKNELRGAKMTLRYSCKAQAGCRVILSVSKIIRTGGKMVLRI